MKTIEQKLERLPQNLQQEVMDFLDYLLEKQKKKSHKTLKLDWVGGLKEYKDKFTAIELQKMSMEWWDDKCI